MSAPRWLDHEEVRRWITTRCVSCGHRFRWRNDARFSLNRDIYHGKCLALIETRNESEERLTVVALAMDVGRLTSDDLRQVAELRDGHKGWDRTWRVLRSLERRHEREATP